ncbi:hypothetical protein QTP70_014189, partial [Hemibagrus guttatus]
SITPENVCVSVSGNSSVVSSERYKQKTASTALELCCLASIWRISDSLSNKMDELLLLSWINKDFSNSAALCFTESWLNDAIPDNALNLPSCQLFRTDPVTESGKLCGGGTCFYINERPKLKSAKPVVRTVKTWTSKTDQDLQACFDCTALACFKRSIIIIPKKSKITGLNDYRPVALTSVVMKLFERLVLAYLKNLTGPLLEPLQFAYRTNRSVDDAVKMGLHFILQHLDKSGTYVRLLFVDFSSAFNTIMPTLLQTKLTQFSVPSAICSAEPYKMAVTFRSALSKMATYPEVLMATNFLTGPTTSQGTSLKLLCKIPESSSHHYSTPSSTCYILPDHQRFCHFLHREDPPDLHASPNFIYITQSALRYYSFVEASLNCSSRRGFANYRSCNPTTCPLDPIPSTMLQTISPDLLPFITTVINGSLTSGHVPTAFKKDRVIPILKKLALDPSDISTYNDCASEDSFELHSVDLELEAVEKQIHDLQVKQAQLQQRKATLESSRTDAHLSQAQRKDAARRGFVHSGAGVPRSLDTAAGEGVPAILKKNIRAVVLHAGTNDIRLRQTEILKKDFRSLMKKVCTTSPTTRIIVSGPLPTFQQGIERFSRLFAFNEWLQSWCQDQKLPGIFSRRVLASTVLMACTQAESSQTTSPGHYAPSDCAAFDTIDHNILIDCLQNHIVNSSDIMELHVRTVKHGGDVTMECDISSVTEKDILVWYRQRSGKVPQYFAKPYQGNLGYRFPEGFNDNRFSISVNDHKFDLKIKEIKVDDVGEYFCGESEGSVVKFTSRTHLQFEGKQFCSDNLLIPDQHFNQNYVYICIKC